MNNLEYKIINPDNVSDDNQVHNDSAYLHNTRLKGLVKSESKRPLVKISSPTKSIIRRARGKNEVKSEEILLDYTSIRELDSKSGHTVKIEEINSYDRWFRYYAKHPKESIRLGYYAILITALLTIMSFIR